MVINSLITLLIRAMIFYLVNGLFKYWYREKGVTLVEERDEKAMFNLIKHLDKCPFNKEKYKKDGLVRAWSIKKQNEILAGLILVDLSKYKLKQSRANFHSFIDPAVTYEVKFFVNSKLFFNDEILLFSLLFQGFRESIRNDKNRLLISSSDVDIRKIQRIGCKSKFLFSEEKVLQRIQSERAIVYHTYLIKCNKRNLTRLLRKNLKRFAVSGFS